MKAQNEMVRLGWLDGTKGTAMLWYLVFFHFFVIYGRAG